jgi:hypothetical protein
MKPWRYVVNTKRGPLSQNGALTVIQKLDCGHEFQFIGTAAIAARKAQRRKCIKCPDVAPKGIVNS